MNPSNSHSLAEPIFHSRPWITQDDMVAVTQVLGSKMLAQGHVTRQFELAMSAWVGGEDGVAVGSGTAALCLSLFVLNVRAGDEVVLPTYVCTSVLDAVIATGATPILCDVGEKWLLTPDMVANSITGRTKALIVPHMYGIFADVRSFRKFGVAVVEDCAQAVDDRMKRSIEGDVAVFSFHPTKCLTTGEGGMAVSRDSEILHRLRRSRDGATTGDTRRFFSPMSDVSAALGLSQLARYPDALRRRKVLADRYKAALAMCAPLCLHEVAPASTMHFRFPIKVRGGLDSCQRAFEQRGVSVRRGVDKLLHRSRNLLDRDFPIAVSLFESTVSLPIYPALSDEQHSHCVRAAVEILGDQIDP